MSSHTPTLFDSLFGEENDPQKESKNFSDKKKKNKSKPKAKEQIDLFGLFESPNKEDDQEKIVASNTDLFEEVVKDQDVGLENSTDTHSVDTSVIEDRQSERMDLGFELDTPKTNSEEEGIYNNVATIEKLDESIIANQDLQRENTEIETEYQSSNESILSDADEYVNEEFIDESEIFVDNQDDGIDFIPEENWENDNSEDNEDLKEISPIVDMSFSSDESDLINKNKNHDSVIDNENEELVIDLIESDSKTPNINEIGILEETDFIKDVITQELQDHEEIISEQVDINNEEFFSKEISENDLHTVIESDIFTLESQDQSHNEQHFSGTEEYLTTSEGVIDNSFKSLLEESLEHSKKEVSTQEIILEIKSEANSTNILEEFTTNDNINVLLPEQEEKQTHLSELENIQVDTANKIDEKVDNFKDDTVQEIDQVESYNDEKIELPNWNLDKNYYTIGSVAKMFNVNISHIRFWTNEFNLKPRTNKKGDRLYTPENIRTLQLIHHLVKVQKHTIKGAKEKLKTRKKAVEAGRSLKEYLTQLKETLTQLRVQLD